METIGTIVVWGSIPGTLLYFWVEAAKSALLPSLSPVSVCRGLRRVPRESTSLLFQESK